MSKKWDGHFIELATQIAKMSKDPSTQVGAVMVGSDREILSTGFNGFPRGIEDTLERLTNRDLKLSLIVHAEMNAILQAARNGVSTKGRKLYLAATDGGGQVWGGPPCTRCTVEIIQSGVSEIISPPLGTGFPNWKASIEASFALLKEAGVVYREV